MSADWASEPKKIWPPRTTGWGKLSRGLCGREQMRQRSFARRGFPQEVWQRMKTSSGRCSQQQSFSQRPSALSRGYRASWRMMSIIRMLSYPASGTNGPPTMTPSSPPEAAPTQLKTETERVKGKEAAALTDRLNRTSSNPHPSSGPPVSAHTWCADGRKALWEVRTKTSQVPTVKDHAENRM